MMRKIEWAMLAPIFFPRWNFFDRIGSAWSLEWQASPSEPWQPLVDEPRRLSFPASWLALIWNPDRNEFLFLVSLAERAFTEEQKELLELLSSRLASHLRRRGVDPRHARYRILADHKILITRGFGEHG